MELIVDRVSKHYKNKIAVDRLSLKLQNGVYGLLGANGAGKTTLMRMICGILTPTSGTLSFAGVDVSEESYRSILGYLPQDFGYYPKFSGQDFLLYMAVLKGLTKPQARKRAAELLQLVSLQDAAKKKIKTYSGGMKQRLGIAQALLNREGRTAHLSEQMGNVFNQYTLSLFGHHLAPWQAVPMIYLAASVAAAFLGMPLYNRYQISGR